jgi:hypothetical protein
MVKIFLIAICVIFQFFGFVLPVNAEIPPGSIPLSYRPNYKKQIEYIIENSCKPIGLIPYDGLTYYTCPSGESFWSQVLSPIPDLITLGHLDQQKRHYEEENY